MIFKLRSLLIDDKKIVSYLHSLNCIFLTFESNIVKDILRHSVRRTEIITGGFQHKRCIEQERSSFRWSGKRWVYVSMYKTNNEILKTNKIVCCSISLLTPQ